MSFCRLIKGITLKFALCFVLVFFWTLYVLGSYFRILAVMLVSDFFVWLLWLGGLKIIHSTSADAWKVTGIWQAIKKSSSRLQLRPFVEKNGLSFFYTLLQRSEMRVVFIWCLCLHSFILLLKQLSTHHDSTTVTTKTLKNIIQAEKIWML